MEPLIIETITIQVDTDDGEGNGDADGSHAYGYAQKGLLWNDSQPYIRFYKKINNQGAVKYVAITLDGRLMDGDTGASRPNLMMQGNGPFLAMKKPKVSVLAYRRNTMKMKTVKKNMTVKEPTSITLTWARMSSTIAPISNRWKKSAPERSSIRLKQMPAAIRSILLTLRAT
jgi:hypothetical protein